MSDLIKGQPAGPPVAWHVPVPAQTYDEHHVELRQVVATVWRYRWQIVLVALLVIIPAGIWTLTADPVYRATTLLQIDPDPVQVFPYRDPAAPGVSTQFDMFLKGQDELLRGEALKQRVAQRLRAESDRGLASEAPMLWGRLDVQGIENTYMFRVGYRAPDPAVAATVANLFAEEFIKQHFETQQQTREKARELLGRELASLETRVQESERGLISYAQGNRLSVDEKLENPARAELDAMALQRTKVEGEVYAARSRLTTLERATVDQFPATLIGSTISSLDGGLLRLEGELTSLQATYGPNWPAVIAKRQELDLAREQLVREKQAALARALDQARLDLAVAESNQQMLESRLAQQQGLVNQIENARIQYNIIRREVDTNQKMYDGMLERLSQTSLTAGMEFGGIQVVERASPPSEVDSPNLPWNMGLATMLGVTLGLCLAVGREYWDTSLTSVEELSRQTGLPVLGAVPLVEGPAARGPRALLPKAGGALRLRSRNEGPTARASRFEAYSPGADAVRNVCTSILLSRSDRPPRVLMVTSATSGEGKTTMARELAYAFGERGARTVLIECDLRRPKFTELFGLSEQGSLTPWLAGAVPGPPTVHELEGGLSVVAAGPRAPNPVVLLYSDRLKAFVDSLLQQYRFVILDASPTLGLADARVLAAVADGAVIVARAGKSEGHLLRKVRDDLSSAGVNILGTVLNGVDPELVRGYLGDEYYQ